MTVTVNDEEPPRDLVVDRKTKGAGLLSVLRRIGQDFINSTSHLFKRYGKECTPAAQIGSSDRRGGCS